MKFGISEKQKKDCGIFPVYWYDQAVIGICEVLVSKLSSYFF